MFCAVMKSVDEEVLDVVPVNKDPNSKSILVEGLGQCFLVFPYAWNGEDIYPYKDGTIIIQIIEAASL